MKHHEARVGDTVKETAGGPDMRVFAYDSGGNLHCCWDDDKGARQEKTFDPATLTMVRTWTEEVTKTPHPEPAKEAAPKPAAKPASAPPASPKA